MIVMNIKMDSKRKEKVSLLSIFYCPISNGDIFVQSLRSLCYNKMSFLYMTEFKEWLIERFMIERKRFDRSGVEDFILEKFVL